MMKVVHNGTLILIVTIKWVEGAGRKGIILFRLRKIIIRRVENREDSEDC
jgi:hypothetical protein